MSETLLDKSPSEFASWQEGWREHAKVNLVRAPVTYAALYPWLVSIGREHGYAIALHGSLHKDMDVIAVPWTAGASAAEDLVDAVVERIGLEIQRAPTDKPHGRRVWTLLLTHGGSYIDFGVMPLTPSEAPEVEG